MRQIQGPITIALLCVIIVLQVIDLQRAERSEASANLQRSDLSNSRLDPKKDPYVANQVKNTIVKRSAELQECYNEFLERKPKKTDGQVVMDWTVSEQGSAINPEVVSNQLKEKKMGECLAMKIRAWKFPPPSAAKSHYVEHKFFFKKTE